MSAVPPIWLSRHFLAPREIRPVIDRTYALDDIVDAHSYVEMGHKRGIVITSVI